MLLDQNYQKNKKIQGKLGNCQYKIQALEHSIHFYLQQKARSIQRQYNLDDKQLANWQLLKKQLKNPYALMSQFALIKQTKDYNFIEISENYDIVIRLKNNSSTFEQILKTKAIERQQDRRIRSMIQEIIDEKLKINKNIRQEQEQLQITTAIEQQIQEQHHAQHFNKRIWLIILFIFAIFVIINNESFNIFSEQILKNQEIIDIKQNNIQEMIQKELKNVARQFIGLQNKIMVKIDQLEDLNDSHETNKLLIKMINDFKEQKKQLENRMKLMANQLQNLKQQIQSLEQTKLSKYDHEQYHINLNRRAQPNSQPQNNRHRGRHY